MTNCSNWKSKHVISFRAIFSWVSKEIQDCFGLASLCSLIGQENSLMDQSEVISRTIWSRGFPALEVGYVFLLWVPIGSLWSSSVLWLAVVITLDTKVNWLQMQTSQVSIEHFSTEFRQTKIKVISTISQNIGNIRKKKNQWKIGVKRFSAGEHEWPSHKLQNFSPDRWWRSSCEMSRQTKPLKS